MNKKYLHQTFYRCLFLLFFLITTFSSWAETKYVTVDKITYALDTERSTAVVNKVNNSIVTAIIPDKIEGCVVTGIGYEAFYFCTSLTSVTIPSSVSNIDERAFYACTSLASINVSEDNPYYTSEDNVLFNKDKTELICCNNKFVKYIIPSTVEKIGKAAFFYNSNLSSITIPSSVKKIGEGAFVGCISLRSINVSTENSNYTSIDNVLFNKDMSKLIFSAYRGKEYVIPSSVKEISYEAFGATGSSLESIVIPSSVVSIGNYAFYACNSLTSVIIPSSVTNIGECAFIYCHNLTSVTISSSVTSIGWGAFRSCEKLCVVSSEVSESILKNLLNDVPLHKVKSNDYCSIYSNKNLSKNQEKLIDDYLEAKAFIRSHNELYASLGESLRFDFEKTLNSALETFDMDEDEVAACDEKLVDAYWAIYEKLNGPFYSLLNDVYKSAVESREEKISFENGLITDASQLSTNAQEPTQGSLEALIDNDQSTFFHSTWTTSEHAGEFHYLQIDLNNFCRSITLKYSVRKGRYGSYDDGTPKIVHVYATNTPNDEKSWTDLGKETCTYDYVPNETGILVLKLNGSYRYVRLVVEETMGNHRTNDNLYFYWSELQAYYGIVGKSSVLTDDELSALDEAIATAKSELETGNATRKTYLALKEAVENLEAKVANAELLSFNNSDHITLYSNRALVVPRGAKAAVVVSNGNEIRSDYRYLSGMVIPANTGVLLKSVQGNLLYFAEGETSEITPSDNLLHGTLTNETTNVAGDNLYYKLSYDAATGTELGFYWGSKNGAPFMNKAGKAFLAIPVAASQSLMGVSLFDLDNGLATGINGTTTDAGSGTLKIYDLNGRRIDAKSTDELQRGIYVVNGKKMYVK